MWRRLAIALPLLWSGAAVGQTAVCMFDSVQELAGATTFTLVIPASCPTPAIANGRITVIDNTGIAQGTNVTITPANGLINGQSSFVFNQNHQAATFFWDGLNWSAM